jgi:hypothetical protein
MSSKSTEIDHIDPRWVEGRDYQLVCGLDVKLNYREDSNSNNSKKSNRFLPWRVADSEIGLVPSEPGDLCLFLDPTTNQWVLEEFLGSWWFESTRSLCGQAMNNSPGGRVAGRMGVESGHLKSISRLGGLVTGRANIAKANSYRFRCTVTGHESTPGPLTIYQKSRGIDPSNRIQII